MSRDLFIINKIFFLKEQIFLFLLLFITVFLLGAHDAFAVEQENTKIPLVTPQIGNFVGLSANTKSDYRWDRIEAPTAQTRLLWSGAFSGSTAEQVMEEVTTWVNSRTKLVDDTTDDWSSANRTLQRGYGDCEDVAITKFQILKSLGFTEEHMFLVLVRDGVSHRDHAILLVRTENGNLILDNLTNRLVPDSMVLRTYFPVFAYGKNGSWVFGRHNAN